jgi:hypothetical protein
MDKSKNTVSLDEFAEKIFDDRLIDGILAHIHRDGYQFIRVHGDERAFLFTKRLTERANEIKRRIEQGLEVKLYTEGGPGEIIECSDFDYFFFPYVADEEDREDILRSSYSDLRKSLCKPNQRLVIVLVDSKNKLEINRTYHVDIGYFINGFERRNLASQ